MGFESKILKVIEPLQENNGSRAYFENGSLFVENIDDESAWDIIKVLKALYGSDALVTPYPAINGFVVDFG
jgi:hypothetical protein